MNGEVRLAVAIEIQAAERDAAFDRLFEDAGDDRAALDRNFAGDADVEGEDFHVRVLRAHFSGSCWADSLLDAGVGETTAVGGRLIVRSPKKTAHLTICRTTCSGQL